MSEYVIIRGDDRKEFDDYDAFNNTVDFLDKQGEEFTTETPGDDAKADGSGWTPGDEGTPAAKEADPVTDDGPELIGHPIAYLRGINDDFVNVISGTPAISKRGFRYMQTELGISTEAEVVATLEDPVGVIVHARAEMPDGRCAEAHGEGYLTESGVEDNEWVRYADTRAKNRAISDLTSSGALSEAEL